MSGGMAIEETMTFAPRPAYEPFFEGLGLKAASSRRPVGRAHPPADYR